MTRTLLAISGFLLLAVAHGATLLDERFRDAGENAAELKGFVEAARESHGEFGERAAVFLIEGMPKKDLKGLKQDFLTENLDLAMKARGEFPWAKDLPEEVFCNDVLPYASLDETRESWRPNFYEECRKLVADCQTSTEAAQVINRDFFKLIKVHYNTGRKAPNQSPSESKALGMATCTGLSIILVDACRAVGVPARVAGTALWSNKRGNHTWIEIYDNGEWFFTGADEYNKDGLNRGWFTNDASKAIESDWKHAIWATSWKPTGSHFPMVWNLENREVPGVNVTSRYVKADTGLKNQGVVYLRLWDKKGGERLVAEVELLDANNKVLQKVLTKAGTADLNDMPGLKVALKSDYQLRLVQNGEERMMNLKVGAEVEMTKDLFWAELPEDADRLNEVRTWLALLPEERHLSIPEISLSADEAKDVAGMIWKKILKEVDIQAELEAKLVKAAGKEMKYLERTFGEAKEGERSLWISMHGGGGAPARVNDQQWQNQIRLYSPKEGIVIAPRAPTDTWNLWHEGHIDDLFQTLIDQFVMKRGISPDRIYLMGYSAGGDGVYQLAPRMADRFAAASMMAGHPNDAKPDGLRNLPFMIFMGGKDAAYDRNKIAAVWGGLLGDLKKNDPAGYEHKVTIYPDFGHWMNGKDQEALPWMSAHTRNPWPKKIVWRQSGRTHDRFYWLSVPKEQAKAGQTLIAEVQEQTITLTADEGLEEVTLRLHDSLIDLDQPITVIVNGEEKFKGKVDRKVGAIWQSLKERKDQSSVASALLKVKF